MPIVSVKEQITKFFTPSILIEQAKYTGFMERIRVIKPLVLVTSFVAALSKGNVTLINEMLRQFNALNAKGKRLIGPIGKHLKQVTQKNPHNHGF